MLESIISILLFLFFILSLLVFYRFLLWFSSADLTIVLTIDNSNFSQRSVPSHYKQKTFLLLYTYKIWFFSKNRNHFIPQIFKWCENISGRISMFWVWDLDSFSVILCEALARWDFCSMPIHGPKIFTFCQNNGWFVKCDP